MLRLSGRWAASAAKSSWALSDCAIWNSLAKPRSPPACRLATRWMYRWAGMEVLVFPPPPPPPPPLLPSLPPPEDTDDSASQSGTTLGDGVEGEDSSR